MQRAFSEAVINSPHRVLGIRLRPFSAAHFFTLESVNSPIVVGGNVEITDFLYALKICSRNPKFIHGAWSVDTKIRFTLLDHFRVFQLLNARLKGKAFKAWQAYQNDYQSLPEHMQSEGLTPSISAPGILAAVVSGMRFMSEKRAWTMPLSLLICYTEVRSEMSGGKVRFEPDEREKKEIKKQLEYAEQKGRELLEERKKCQG